MPNFQLECPNSISAGAPPQTPLAELTVLPRPGGEGLTVPPNAHPHSRQFGPWSWLCSSSDGH